MIIRFESWLSISVGRLLAAFSKFVIINGFSGTNCSDGFEMAHWVVDGWASNCVSYR